MDLTPAGILIPAGGDADRWLHVCATIAEIEGWHVEEVVRTWDDLKDMLCHGRIDIGLVGRHKHLPADRRPRLVIAEDYRPPTPPIPRQRRPQWQPRR